MVVYMKALVFTLITFLGFHFPSLTKAGCPLDLTSSNFTLVSSVCSNHTTRAKCCRYINAFVAVSIARYANYTTSLGVTPDLTTTCITTFSKTMELYGIPKNASSLCGLGTKILVSYNCEGLTTVPQMLRSVKFGDVGRNCKLPLPPGNRCRACLNSGITYIHRLMREKSNVKVSTCRDAIYAVLASQVDNSLALQLASCFFNVPELYIAPESYPSLLSPEVSPSPVLAESPSSNDLVISAASKSRHHSYLTVVLAIGITVIAFALMMLLVLIVLIKRKKRELDDSECIDRNPIKTFPSLCSRSMIHEGNWSAFRKFSYKEMRKATDGFNEVIGRGGFGTVHKAEFSNGLVAAVKKMNKSSEQADDDEFRREIELLSRLHHRHLVALKGFCIKKYERFLVYEYMANGSLKDHLHSTERPPLSWARRMKIAVDLANALEYLHFYCDPPLCHRDIKSSNILLDENFVAKLADFGLAHASRDGSICFEPEDTDIRGTPGYVDPEYVVTQELTEKSDMYSYGVVLLEIITGRSAVDEEGRNLVEMSRPLLVSETRRVHLVDPRIKDCIDGEQLETVVAVVRWCTEKEGVARPSIKQVLRLLSESCDQLHLGLAMAVEEDRGRSVRGDSGFQSGDIRGFASSSSGTTSRSHCSRSLLLETGSPPNGFSF